MHSADICAQLAEPLQVPVQTVQEGGTGVKVLTKYVVLEEHEQEESNERSRPFQPLTVCLQQSSHAELSSCSLCILLQQCHAMHNAMQSASAR